jgi:hypothetical protein
MHAGTQHTIFFFQSNTKREREMSHVCEWDRTHHEAHSLDSRLATTDVCTCSGEHRRLRARDELLNRMQKAPRTRDGVPRGP